MKELKRQAEAKKYKQRPPAEAEVAMRVIV